MFYEDDEILNLESKVLSEATLKANSLNHRQAIRHLREGYNRRHLMMQTSRIFVREKTSRSPEEILSTYLALELGVHLNAYYLNLCGALDNLAWVLTYELNLNPSVNETLRSRTYCNLFGQGFLQDVRSIRPNIAEILEENRDWNQEIKEFRDPAAHRIPIYAAPGILDEQQLEEFRRIEAQAAKVDGELSVHERISFLTEARSLSKTILL